MGIIQFNSTKMKSFKLLVASFLIGTLSYAQTINPVQHIVGTGENLQQVATKYKVTSEILLKLNPEASKGIKPGMKLKLPASSAKKVNATVSNTTPSKPTVVTAKATTHKVATKETLFGIAEKYGTTSEVLIGANKETLSKGVKVGQVLTIPARTLTIKPVVPKVEKPVFHEVKAKETKWSIATQYAITVEQLEKLNPEIAESLPLGYLLLVKGKATPQDRLALQNSTVKPVEKIKNTKPITFINYEVKPKETLYSLSKRFALTQESLLKMNPELLDGVKEGMIIKIPDSVSITEETGKPIIDLTKSLNTTTKKQLAILLPFNLSKIQKDTVNSTQVRLKKDKFLNMTLDFYSGVLMAIDSAKTLGINVDITILDSQETKNSSNISQLVLQNDLSKKDAIIGPFYQSNVEKLAELLKVNKVPVISPLSKEAGKSFPNLLQTMPQNEFILNEMFEYLNAKDSKIIAIVDSKKQSMRQYLKENQKKVSILRFDDKGGIALDTLKTALVKNKINYVVLDSNKTDVILSATDAMLTLLEEYQIQLVILEPNATLDFEEIAISRLSKLKMMYPSVSLENETQEYLKFANEYRLKNKILPNAFAVRGFDITFDTLLRLSQEKAFLETISTTATKQIENKFDYNKKVTEGYINKGFYILYYDIDLSIKEAQ